MVFTITVYLEIALVAAVLVGCVLAFRITRLRSKDRKMRDQGMGEEWSQQRGGRPQNYQQQPRGGNGHSNSPEVMSCQFSECESKPAKVFLGIPFCQPHYETLGHMLDIMVKKDWPLEGEGFWIATKFNPADFQVIEEEAPPPPPPPPPQRRSFVPTTVPAARQQARPQRQAVAAQPAATRSAAKPQQQSQQPRKLRIPPSQTPPPQDVEQVVEDQQEEEYEQSPSLEAPRHIPEPLGDS